MSDHHKRNIRPAYRVQSLEAVDGDCVREFASVQETALYIADITLQMRNMAREANLNFLAYLLEMAFQEAFDIGNERNGRDAGSMRR